MPGGGLLLGGLRQLPNQLGRWLGDYKVPKHLSTEVLRRYLGTIDVKIDKVIDRST